MMSFSDDQLNKSSHAIQELVLLGREKFALDLPGDQHQFNAFCWSIRSLSDRSTRNCNEKLYFTRYRTTDDPLPDTYADIIKSWVILERGSLANMDHRVDAARILWEAI